MRIGATRTDSGGRKERKWMKKRLIRFVPLLSLGLIIAIFAAWSIVVRAEQLLESRANRVLSATGASWAQAYVDGLKITITGVAPTLDAPLLAERRLKQSLVWAEIRNQTVAPKPVAQETGNAKIEIMRGLNQIIISGRAPTEFDQSALANAMQVHPRHLAITDFVLHDDTAATPPEWAAAQTSAARVVGDLLHGRTTLTPTNFVVVGLAKDEAALHSITAELLALGQLGWTTEHDVTMPQVAADTMILRVSVGDAAAGFHECSVKNAADAERLSQQAAELFGPAAAKCRVEGDDQHPAWTRIAFNALNAVRRLPRADLVIRGRRIELTGVPPTRKRAIEAVMADLQASGPDDFEFVLRGGVSSEWASRPSPAADEGESRQLNFVAHLSADGGLRLSGALPTSGGLEAVQTLAAFPGARIEADTVELDLERPTGWRRSIGAGLSGLAQLNSGMLQVKSGSVQLSGEVADAGRIKSVHETLSAGMAHGWGLASRLTVPIQKRSAAQPRPVSRCAAEMARIVLNDPIMFAPASSQIEPASLPVIAKLARALTGCEGGRIEISGHTDSQGREAANLGLSRVRADAVLDALLAEGVSIRKLVALGYGEANPIASNATAAGRALNRRIEFSVSQEEP